MTYTIDFSGPSNDDSSSGSNSQASQPSSESSSERLGDSYDNTSAAQPSSASGANSPTRGQEEGSDSSSTTPSSASASEGEPYSSTPASSISDDGQSSDEQQVPFSGSSNHTPPVPDTATEESPSMSQPPVDVPSPAPVPPANVTTAEPLHPASTPLPPPPPPSTKSEPPQTPPAVPENVRAMLLDKIPKAAMLGSDIHTASWRVSANIPPIILGLIAAGVYLFLKLTNRPLPGPTCWLLWSDCLLVPAAAVHIASESPIANVISGLLTSITLTGHFAFLACLAGTVLAPSIAEMEEKQSEVRRGPKSRLRASLHRLQPPATDPSTSTPLLPSRAWRGPVVAAVACTTLLTITVGITNFFAMIFVALKSLSDATGALRAEACLAAITTILGNSLAFFATARSGQAFEAHRAQKAAGARALIGSCILEFADSALSIAYPYFNESPLGQLLLLLSGLCLIFAAVMVTSVFLHASPHSARGATRTIASPEQRCSLASKTRPAHPSVHQETMMASEVRPLSQVTRLSQILGSPAPTKIRSPGSSFVSAASDDDYAAGAVIIAHPGVAPSAQEYGVARKVSYKASHHRHDSESSAISAVDQHDSMASHEIIADRAQCDDASEMPADARIHSGSRYSGESWDAGFKARNDARRSKWRSQPLQRSSTRLSKRISALLTAVGWNGNRKSEGPDPGTAPSAYGPDHPDGTFIRAPSPQRQSNSTHLSVTSFMSVLARKRDGHTDSTPALDLGHGPREVVRHPLHECTTADSLVRPLNTTSSISRPDALSKVAYDTSGDGAGRPISAVPEVREVAARIDQPFSNANLDTADRVFIGTARAIPEPPASPTIKIERCPEETEPRPSSSIETRDPSSPAARLPVPTSSQSGLLSPEVAATHRHIGA
ncbi:hypothetical protein CBOM_06439 [Ceraceosorus bombacis]|uniref:Uncharacterized protein n=1 Tax=Ceraceosorus bombacis TaxID=401625 RepID=A0A0N7LAG2_9BASI|nr:hypothetical protein CBOM_06439 [Ceraceosorus bombacis]